MSGALALADANFQVVLAESRPRTSLRVLERVPRHFQRWDSMDDEGPEHRTSRGFARACGDVRRLGGVTTSASHCGRREDDLELHHLLAAKLTMTCGLEYAGFWCPAGRL